MVVSCSTAAVQVAVTTPSVMYHGRRPKDAACVHTWLVRRVAVKMNFRSVRQGEYMQLLAKGLREIVVAKRTEDAALP